MAAIMNTNFLFYLFFLLVIFTNSPQPLASDSSTEDLFHIFNDAKLKYDQATPPGPPPTKYTHVPTIYYPYNLTNIGTELLLVFMNQSAGHLVAKSDPSWADLWSHKTECGASSVLGEIRTCVDSMESMINFVTPIMGNKVTPMSTPPGKLQTYKVVGPVRTIRHEATPCHHKDAPGAPFALYGCHFIPNSQVRLVPLLGADGSSLQALTVCHMDTSSWNPKGFILDLLKMKPGPSVCHFLSTDDLVWVRY